MTLEVTERWEGTSHERTERGWRATRLFDVTGTNNGQRATLAPGIPSKGDAHPANPILLLNTKRARQRGPQWFTVTCNYTVERIGGRRSDQDENLDPLFEPAEIDFRYANEQEEFDRTPRGFAILNSASKPYDSNPTRDAGPTLVSVERNEPFFDADKSLRFRNLINTDVVRLEGRILFGELVGRVLSIEPVSKFSFDDNYVPVRYTFMLRDRVIVDGQPVSSHHLRLMDRGYYERIQAPSGDGTALVPIRDDEAEVVNEPQPLNGKGAVLGTDDGAGPPAGVLATERTEDAVWFWWQRYPEGPYRGLF